MHIKSQDPNHIVIILLERKAQDLLDGLLEHTDLGTEAVELAKKLQAVGVKPKPLKDHIRYEHAGPLDG